MASAFTQVRRAARRPELRRILLVEDDPDIQTVTSVVLGRWGGFTVKVCGSAREALDAAPRFKPDLILLDVVMPEMDGVRALHALRRMPTVADVPVVFVTARVQPQEVRSYKTLGSVDVIAKPFEPTALVDTIRRIWKRHHV